MGLLEEALSIQPGTGHVCHVERAVIDHPEIADEIAQLILHKQIKAAVVETVLRQHDVHLTAANVLRHRNHKCVRCKEQGQSWA